MKTLPFIVLGLASTLTFASADPALLELIEPLPSGAKIPAAAYTFESRDLAEALIKRQEKIDLARSLDPAKPSFDFLHRTDVVLAFPYKYFSSIQQSGFLNQFQVDHSANMDRKHRLLVEDQIIGLRLKRSSNKKDRANELRPKYAYLNLQVDFDEEPELSALKGTQGLNVSYNYGAVFAKFKDEVKDRATFTAGDSLYIFGTQTGDARSFISTQTTPVGAYEYWEAQIWGKLTIDDVEYFLVNCGTQGGINGDLTKDQIQVIKDAGHEVYQCVPKYLNPIFKFGRYRLDKGARL